jgi:hypothetical protein
MDLRLHIGDIDAVSPRYLDEWLRVALVSALKSLQRWWRIRYTIDSTTYIVSRYVNSLFTEDAPPIIAQSDEEPIILMASILIKSGILQDNSWSIGTWRDAEIYVSNVEGGKLKDASLKADNTRLLEILKPPTKRLNAGLRTHIGRIHAHRTDYVGYRNGYGFGYDSYNEW